MQVQFPSPLTKPPFWYLSPGIPCKSLKSRGPRCKVPLGPCTTGAKCFHWNLVWVPTQGIEVVDLRYHYTTVPSTTGPTCLYLISVWVPTCKTTEIGLVTIKIHLVSLQYLLDIQRRASSTLIYNLDPMLINRQDHYGNSSPYNTNLKWTLRQRLG